MGVLMLDGMPVRIRAGRKRKAGTEKVAGRLKQAQRMFNELIRADHLLFRLENKNVLDVLRVLTRTERELREEFRRQFRANGKEIENWLSRQVTNAQFSLAQLVEEAWEDARPLVEAGLVDQTEAADLATQRAAALSYPEDPELGELVPFRFKALDRRQIAAIVDTPFNGTAWGARWDRAGEQLINATLDSVLKSRILGEDVRRATTRLMRAYNGDLGRQRAEMIVRTENIRVLQAARKAWYDDNANQISGFTYVATLDNRTCLRCGSLDGTTWFKDPEAERQATDFPIIPQHPLCRCTSVAVVKSATELGWSDADIQGSFLLQAIDGQPAESTDYPNFLAGQDREFQLDVLGPQRFELFDGGDGVPITDMVSAETGPGGTQMKLLNLAQIRDRLGG